ncbi:MAG: hypothetical protein IPM48_07850 [Saprospiraceae bacterium]|nr:hypothetical protein [Saprospiraceae bacterium]
MKKIDSDFLKDIKSHSKKIFKVLISLQVDADPELLGIKKYTELMPGILSAQLAGSQILKLSKHNAVVTIEPDEEMQVF